MATAKKAKTPAPPGSKLKRPLNTLHVDLHVKKEKGKPRGMRTDHLVPHQFKPGQSGNPGGRPKGSGKVRISDAYASVMASQMPDEFKIAIGVDPQESFTWAEGMALQLLKKAINADSCKPSFKAIQELREVTEGKLPDKNEFAGPNGTPLATQAMGPPVVNFITPDIAAVSAAAKRPIDGPVPSQPVVVPPTANVPVAEVESTQVEESLDLPAFDCGF
jgi:hypothetical protein